MAAEPLSDEEIAQKEAYIEQGFPDWSRRDFQQFVKGLEAYGWYVACPENYASLNLFRGQPFETYAQDIQDKNAEEVEKYYKVFEERWKSLSGKLLL
jgi:SWI/SNF-related matrix-associated actin-dependent regulator of chromatin subfamily A member 5